MARLSIRGVGVGIGIMAITYIAFVISEPLIMAAVDEAARFNTSAALMSVINVTRAAWRYSVVISAFTGLAFILLSGLEDEIAVM